MWAATPTLTVAFDDSPLGPVVSALQIVQRKAARLASARPVAWSNSARLLAWPMR